MTQIFQHIRVDGTPYLRGKQYGSAASEKIGLCLRLYRELFEAYASLRWEEATAKALLFEPFIREYLPEAAEEMRGLAEGAGADYLDILALNCRSELMFALPDGCTSAVIPPAASADGKPYLAQTWDWLKPAQDRCVVLELHQEPLPTLLMVCEAGFIGGKGVNGAGLGCGLNALGIGRGRLGVPLHVLYRGIMNSVKISDAIEAVSGAARAGCGNFLIGAAEGLVMHLEFTPENFDVRMAGKQALAHANHYLSPLFMGQDTLKGMFPCSFPRLHRMGARLDEEQGRLSRELLLDILADHVNFPDSVCSHEDPRDARWSRYCTVYGLFIDLAGRALWVSQGNPCEKNWLCFSL
jgi:isopenicillin-N N-acyltransferase-like protein